MSEPGINDIAATVLRLKTRFAERDHNMHLVDLVRGGEIHRLVPDYFSDDLDKSIVANTIDTAADDIASLQAALPSLACSSGAMRTEADRGRAAKLNKIGYSFWDASELPVNMYRFADGFNSYGFGVFIAEPNYELKTPIIRIEDPHGCYYAKDIWGHLRHFAKVRQQSAGTLAELYPEHSGILLARRNGRPGDPDRMVEMVHWIDREKQVLFLPQENNLVLAQAPNATSRIPVVVKERPTLRAIPRGQFDDVIYVQAARHMMALYQLSATDKAVNAPTMLPADVVDLQYGDNAVMRSNNPGGAGKLDLNVPREVFGLVDQMDQELKAGARYPDARTGGVQGSIITGRGVEAMLGGFDTQIKQAQTVLGQGLEEITSLCLEMDAALWGSQRKTISGIQAGQPFQLNYVPARDIGTESHNWRVKVTYGFAAGMTPAQAIVALLQLRGDQLIGRDTVRRQLPFDIDTASEQQALDVEQLEDSLKQGMAALLQALGPMILQGQPAEPVLLAAAQVIQARQKGTPLYEGILEAFKPPEPSPEEQAAAEQQAAQPEAPPGGAAPGGEELPPGIRESGLTQGVAYGQQGMPPGGMPSIQSLISGFRGENQDPRMSAETLRKRPTGVG